MTPEDGERRPSRLIQEEILDLTGYLDGVPPSLRASGALRAYEARLSELQRELIVSSVREWMPEQDWSQEESLDAVAARLERLEREHENGLRVGRNWQDLLTSSALVGAIAGVVVGLVSGSMRTVLPVIGASALPLVAELALQLPRRSLERQRSLSRVRALRNALAHIQEGSIAPTAQAQLLISVLADRPVARRLEVGAPARPR